MKKILTAILGLGLLCAAGAQSAAQDASVPLDEAVVLSAGKIEASLPKGARVAVLNCASSSERLSAYIVDELVLALVDSGRLVVVERENLQLVKDELEFQLSGDVSDESAQSIGKLLGAEVIITSVFDEAKTLRLKAVAVETARVLAVSSVTVRVTDALTTLDESRVLVLDCAPGNAGRELAATVSSIMVSAVSSSLQLRAVTASSDGGASIPDLGKQSVRDGLRKLTGASSALLGNLTVDSGLWFLTVTRRSLEDGSILASSTETYRSAGTVAEGAAGQVLRCLGIQAAADDRRVITVTNMTELLQAIGPDRIIKIAPGSYDLSKGYQVKNRYITWVDEYDGPCPVIKSVSNMALIGEGNATLMIKPAYGWVMSFDTCSGIRISGLVFGHTVPGYCLGGVLRFKNCDDTEIRSCELYGSGTYGLGLERATRFVMEDCDIHDCTYGLATIEQSRDVTFTGTSFRQTGEFDLISVTASDHLSWTDCRFEGNWGSTLFYVDGESRDLNLTGCSFSQNKVSDFCNRADAFVTESLRFRANKFRYRGQ